jgi:hypothetical protein
VQLCLQNPRLESSLKKVPSDQAGLADGLFAQYQFGYFLDDLEMHTQKNTEQNFKDVCIFYGNLLYFKSI